MRKVGATLYKAIQKKFGVNELLSYLEEEANFSFIELYLPDEDLLTATLNLNSEQLQEFKELAFSYNFEITAHGLYDNNIGIISNLADLDDTLRSKAVKSTKRSIELCNFLDCKILVVHPGTLFPDQKRKKTSSMNRLATHSFTRSEGIKNIKRSVKELLTYAEDFGVILCLENEVPRFETIPVCDNPFSLIQLCQTIYEEFGSDFCGITLDIGHLGLECAFYGYDILQTIKSFQPFVKHIHLHDNRMIPCPLGGTKADDGLGDLHYPIGDGSIPYSEIIPLLNNINTDTVLNFEIFRVENKESFKSSREFVNG